MHKNSVSTLTAIGMVVAALIVCYRAQRVDPAVYLLPIDRFPKQVGAWTAGQDIALDPAVQSKIPTAKVLERNYTLYGGKTADLLLLTATDDEDYHQPTACLPGQGWMLSDQRTVPVEGHTVNLMTAEKDGAAFTVLYYWVKLQRPSKPHPESPFTRIYGLRQLVDHESLSLFVRIAMPARLQDSPDLIHFAELTWNALQPLLAGKSEIVLQS